MRDFWKKFLAGFILPFVLVGGVMAGGSGPTVVEPYIWLNDGSAAAPAISFITDIDTGIYHAGTNNIFFASAGNSRWLMRDDIGLGFQIGSALPISWSSGASVGSTSDLQIWRDAANVLAQRRGANAQEFRLYNTYTSASDYERANMAWSSNVLRFSATAAGTGTARIIAVNGVYTVATLPACVAASRGARATVTDATAPAFLAALVGGGAVVSPAFCDGTKWVAG